MLSAATILWIVQMVGAMLTAIYAALKLLWLKDRKRQTTRPSRHEFASALISAGDELQSFLPRRRAPVFASQQMEKVARFGDIAPLIRTGDVLLFSGRTVWSYLIRVFTFSPVSHAGIAVVDDDGIWVVDSCEGVGVTKRPLALEVRHWPGQWYWSPLASGHRSHYARKSVYEAAHAMLGQKYGWWGIVVQTIIHAPILRELAYFGGIDRLFHRLLPFCSAAVVKIMRTGGVDPVRARDAALVTPQDIFQSAAISEPIAILP